jgi:hypothetical protein
MNYVAFFVTELALDRAPLAREMHSETLGSIDLEQPRVHAPVFNLLCLVILGDGNG